jgi:hypothetical protein
MIYVVERSSGNYEDYRTTSLFYSTDKKKAQLWCNEAMMHARKQDEKREKLMRKLDELSEDEQEQWNKTYDRAQNVKSKYDKTLDSSNLSDANYYVVEVKELK